MKAVVDTNILIRAVIKPEGTVGPVLHRLRDGHYTILYTDPLLEELVDVLGRPRLRKKYGVTDHAVETLLRLILLRGREVNPQRSITVCRDPKDDKFLEAAVAGRAEILVSGDEDLLVLDPFEGIPILPPVAFLALLESNL